MKKIVCTALIFIGIMMSGCDSKKKEPHWKTAETEYEGFPLLLRAQGGLDYDLLQSQYPQLFIVTHTLDKVQSSGLPEIIYNQGLEEFDVAMVELFSKNKSGITVLVETFGGKRTYYMYVSNNADTEAAMKHIQDNYLEQKLDWEVKSDPQWRFIRKYAKDYGI
jgi:hypothetical protein